MSTLEFEEIATPRPAGKAPRASVAAGRATHPEDICEVAIVGAGPYGLSLAAHLRELGVSFRIFGKPLDTWRAHMPYDMLLKSEGCASNLSHPSPTSTLQAYCADRGIAYAHHNLPVSLDLFLEYADWFREKCVPALEDKTVTALTRQDGRYRLTLDDGEHVRARRVVLAIGIGRFAQVPEILGGLAKDAVSHSFDHRDVSRFKGSDVIVVGAGASAIDTAALLHHSGAKVKIVARNAAVRFHNAPDGRARTVLSRLKRPLSTIGPGWRSFLFVKFPNLFRFLPETLRLEIVRRHLGPAPGWFMRERIDGKVETVMGCRIDGARMMGERVLLQLRDAQGQTKVAECDHVIAATGYRPDLSRLPFMPPDLLAQIATTGGAPSLSAHFQTSVEGLYVAGPAAANSFGPLMRFMTGAEFVAPMLSRHLARTAKAARG